MLPQIVMTGRLVADPELKFTRAGDAFANFTVATNDRVKKGDRWEDGPGCFLDCTVWRGLAETVGDQLRKGQLVTVVGKLRQDTWQDRDGNNRHKHKVDATDVAVTLSRAPGRQSASSGDGWGAASQQPPSDPWGKPAQDDEAPF